MESFINIYTHIAVYLAIVIGFVVAIGFFSIAVVVAIPQTIEVFRDSWEGKDLEGLAVSMFLAAMSATAIGLSLFSSIASFGLCLKLP